MKKMISAVVAASFAAATFAAPVLADSVTIKVKPRAPVVKTVVVRQPCYYKTVKTVSYNKTVIVRKRICP
ncbi:hypothetical protein JJB09_20965 [Rhizobium sp. KVB221]|uniref:Uncharacterized protein n=1 Tax=Rhizobium setariae TaxID=2801340 RepID=A0A936YPT6_9HYPH|nr:hypothetical protein [Rhizobium setariae]MBL0374488.1 hypothetical protein [Rhizobium setariae]